MNNAFHSRNPELKKDYLMNDEQQQAKDQTNLEDAASSSLTRSTRKFAALLGLAALLVILLHATPLGQYMKFQQLKTTVQNAGDLAQLAFFVLSSVLILAGCPRTAIIFAGGTLFGFWVGLALSTFSSLLGSYVMFLIARWLGRDWVKRKLPRKYNLHLIMERQTIFTVLLMRQLPLPNPLLNMVLSLTNATHRIFLLGSFTGFLPVGIVFTLFGSSIGKQSIWLSLFQLVCALALVLVLTLTAWRLRQNATQHGTSNDQVKEQGRGPDTRHS